MDSTTGLQMDSTSMLQLLISSMLLSIYITIVLSYSKEMKSICSFKNIQDCLCKWQLFLSCYMNEYDYYHSALQNVATLVNSRPFKILFSKLILLVYVPIVWA